jgi:hypothetical protein
MVLTDLTPEELDTVTNSALNIHYQENLMIFGFGI